MNRQLTIKEIAPYLNYELNMYCGKLMDTYLIYPILGLANNEFYTYVNGEDDSMGRIWMDIEQYKAKPTLYPLSSLTKEITHKGETFVPIERLLDITSGHNWSASDLLQVSGNKTEDNIYECWVGFNEKPSPMFGYNSEKGFYYLTKEGDSKIVLNQLQLWQKLAEWHIDFQGLIDANLAIDKTTL